MSQLASREEQSGGDQDDISRSCGPLFSRFLSAPAASGDLINRYYMFILLFKDLINMKIIIHISKLCLSL